MLVIWLIGVAAGSVNRPGRIAAFAFYVAGTVVLVNAACLLDQLRAAPQAVQALTFDREFAQFRGPLVLALLIATLVHHLVVTIHGAVAAGHPVPSGCSSDWPSAPC
ncbi:hypothetical protein O7621_23765 [Solwaraspora sp. WMMD937]|uniref:hypothetical protein n=1 Tax=Solwaraspora sp. WMMD937 TaxID=3016090 RepID=UPI00249BFDCB|nr:hypothetical protein [Solwaraspora sp. WMMD937]WFE20857.1 hypothetical protein O7621_23765 [Solwaraspora sp. WMMD937]